MRWISLLKGRDQRNGHGILRSDIEAHWPDARHVDTRYGDAETCRA
jgi:hypothetical protein